MDTTTVLKCIGKVKAHISALELDLLLSGTGVCIGTPDRVYCSDAPKEDLEKLYKLLVDYENALTGTR